MNSDAGNRFSDGRSALSHAARVAAWVAELASVVGLSPADCETLQEVALAKWAGAGASASPEVRAVLAVLQGDATAPPHTERLALLLERVSDLDDSTEHDAEFGETWSGIGELEEDVARDLRMVSAPERQRLTEIVPVFGPVALAAVRRVYGGFESIREVVELVSADPSLAGHMIAAGNAAIFGGMEPVDSIAGAVTRLGTERASKVILGATLKLVLGPAVTKDLWQHSLRMAETVSRLAQRTGAAKSGEGFLLGLVHDIGKVALSPLRAGVSQRVERLCRAGCPCLTVERVIVGVGHDELGANVLEGWRFDSVIVDAVRHHHNPHRSQGRLSALLYLAEAALGWDGEFPSPWRLRKAEEAAQLALADIDVDPGDAIGRVLEDLT